MMPHIISNPAKAHESRKAVADGVLKSSALTSTQKSMIDGIITSSIPEKKRKSGGHKDVVEPVGELSEPNATKTTIGVRRIPGTKFA